MMKTLILFCLTVVSIEAQTLTKSIQLLPDTGETTSFTATFGEDNDYSINAPFYTDNGNGTITDNVTSLMWQKVDGGEMTIENAVIYANNLSLGGFSDWRLPTPIESFSILNHQNNMPAINTTYFTQTTAEYWWTSVFQSGDATKVWCTNSGGGIGNHPKLETVSAGGVKRFHARVVRDANPTSTLTSKFTDNGDNTITDNLTQLIWQKTPVSMANTWELALVYAESLALANASDWRLPNIKELQSLNNESLTNPSVSTTTFPSIGTKNYWSSTSLPNQTTKAWYWNTQFGITTYDTKTNTNYVICVKGNPTAGLEKNDTYLTTVYPNPFTSKIEILNPTGNEYFVLTNNVGQIVFSGKNIENQDFTSLEKGMYFLRIDNNEVVKLVKE
jgi:Protein of unknown function (DUF1566)/Secretion system C-terminal sorting domain